ncbi:hypothetical protein ACTFIT_002138 [Dictyostelium discoideum]
MSSIEKIKVDNNFKIFQDIIDFEILKLIIDYLLKSNKNKNNNQFKFIKFFKNRNELLNYILVSKKWFNFISLIISNNIINNKSFKHWLKINYFKESFLNKNDIIYNKEENQYNKNNIFNSTFEDGRRKLYKINYNNEFSIIKIKESIINDYFSLNLFFHNITIDDFKAIHNQFENGQLIYNRILVNFEVLDYDENGDKKQDILFEIFKYVSTMTKEQKDKLYKLFEILELNIREMEIRNELLEDTINGIKNIINKSYNNHQTELSFNNIVINGPRSENDYDEDSFEVLNYFKFKNINFINCSLETHVNYSTLFNPVYSGQQVESIKVYSGDIDFVEPRNLIKVGEFQNLHTIKIPIKPVSILSDIFNEIGTNSFNFEYHSENVNSNLKEMVNSLISSKSLKFLNITLCNENIEDIIKFHYYRQHGDSGSYDYYNDEKNKNLIKTINQSKEMFSNYFKPLFSELNTSIERIKLDCHGLFNINTFSNLLKNKSLKYLILTDSDFIFYSYNKQYQPPPPLPTKKNTFNTYLNNDEFHYERISINQYLFENIFSSPLTSIRHYKSKIKELDELKSIFKLILNNIFNLQLYSIVLYIKNTKIPINDFKNEYDNLINNIIIQTQQQKPTNININLKEIKVNLGFQKNFKKYILTN